MSRRATALLVAGLTASALLPSCAPQARAGTLPPTLTMEDHGGFAVAVQNGIPVPAFDAQPVRRISLDGAWRLQRAELNADLSLMDRGEALEPILAEAAGRHEPGFEDTGWATTLVPGSTNPPPDGVETGAWYRRTFNVPAAWAGRAAVLKFAAVNYIADVWINGTWVGYHEGGYTPFAFDVAPELEPGAVNTIVVRVANPPWGSRNDIVPWGLADWWNYGGITRSVWIEAPSTLHVVRADVVPHLDGFDATVVVRRAEAAIGGETPTATASPTPGPTATPGPAARRAGTASRPPQLRLELYPAQVSDSNLTRPAARGLVPPGQAPLATDVVQLAEVGPGELAVAESGFLLGGADLWVPGEPALYVLHAEIEAAEATDGGIWTTFGLRDVSVAPDEGRLLLNGQPTMLTGVALHDEVLEPAASEAEVRGRRVTDAQDLVSQLTLAHDVGADLIRAGHTPANPLLLMLADRLGFAVWEEIPLYHYTPLTFAIAIERGIPQQMLREMALRDMNRPSVLFHGLANESTGTDERADALATLHEVDRAIDGTRLTGQAAYGTQPDDPTHAPLDVAGFTFYYDVFYGTDAAADTARALTTAHATHPEKPVIALEFGRWADDADGPQRQQAIFEQTFPAFRRSSSGLTDGFVGGAVWWTLTDYTTMRPGIRIEHFGLFDQDGAGRPAADSASRLFSGDAAEDDLVTDFESDVEGARPITRAPESLALPLYIGYAAIISGVMLGGLLLVLLRRGGRSQPRPHRPPR
jgi:beta-galactosidase